MPTISETTDESVLAILRRHGLLTVAGLAEAMHVTATAVRQRLSRLMAQGLVQRDVQRQTSPGRGRPTHAYSLTSKAKRFAGDNYHDLATVLWEEIRSIKDAEVRRGLLQRLSQALANRYRGRIHGDSVEERMESLRELFADRRIPLSIVDAEQAGISNDIDETTGQEVGGVLPILRVEDCPYPELAEQDRGICAMEKMVFADLLEDDLRLTQCRLDGHSCCEFSTG
ncbi:MAG: MarR family transcriptional regulator [Pirellulales bacterium]|nr:MarR family transcriptional regulator [Pirellulales bacterium]